LADARHAPIAAADQANVIAAILQNPAPHDRQVYPLFGAEELDWHEVAAKVQAALGIPVRYEPIEHRRRVSRHVRRPDAGHPLRRGVAR
jgi:uncharacterized protein YbjT (DUF2867 family)